MYACIKMYECLITYYISYIYISYLYLKYHIYFTYTTIQKLGVNKSEVTIIDWLNFSAHQRILKKTMHYGFHKNIKQLFSTLIICYLSTKLEY